MYERTIACDHRIYEVTLTGTPTKVIDLLSDGDRANYNSFVNNAKANGDDHGDLQNKAYKRIVVDGYITATASALLVSTSASGAQEEVAQDVQFTSPVAFWLDKTWVQGSGSAIVRIFFS